MAQPPNSEPVPKYLYYAPTDVLLLVEHTSNDGSEVPAALRNIFNENQNLRKLIPEGYPFEDLSTLLFSRPEPINNFQYFSILTMPPFTQSAATTVRTINAVIGEQGVIYQIGNTVVRLSKAALNWYSGAATHTAIGTSGSGKRARRVINQAVLAHANYAFTSDFENDLAAEASQSEADIPDVDVYLLDTLPPQNRIEQAWMKWGTAGTDGTFLAAYQRILERTERTGDSQTYQTQQATYLYAADHAFDQTAEKRTDANAHLCDHKIVIHEWRKDPPITAETVDVPEPLCDDPCEADEYETYDVSDHGLFIAGIVHNIAPNAQITVIESMNQYGVGTLWNILKGFQIVQQIEADKNKDKTQDQWSQVIINCSLTLAFPTPDQKGYSPSPDDEGLLELIGKVTPDGIQPARNAVQQVNEQGETTTLHDAIGMMTDLSSALFKAVRDAVQGTTTRILCAAGNDSDRPNGDTRPARYLAAEPDPIGVGALKKNSLNAADYSNFSDDPLAAGYMVFGGDYDESAQPDDAGDGVQDYPDSGNGVISIYTNDFYHMDDQCNLICDANPYGFAEWAGTSFASPALVGTIAKICLAVGNTPSQALTFINNHCQNGAPDVGRCFIDIQQP